ncbi:MAG: protein adenylyltransferase SelO family protein [Cyanobacteria bacterium J06576_12]
MLLAPLEHNKRVSYTDFFAALTRQFDPAWQTDKTLILSSTVENSEPEAAAHLQQWCSVYQQCLAQLPAESMEAVQQCLKTTNPMIVLHRPVIESVWEPIAEEDNWQPFYDLLEKVRHPQVNKGL